MSIMNDIRAVLENHLRTMSGVPPIATPNIKFDPDENILFVRAQFIPRSRRPDVRGPNPMQRYEGLYNLLVCSPTYVGEGAGLEAADSLLARFDATTDITRNGVTVRIDYAELGLSYQDTPFFCTPVVVSWYTYN